MEQWEKNNKITADRFTNHHGYYLQLSKAMGIGWNNARSKFMGKTKEQWKGLYKNDKHLNNHPLKHFDSYYPLHRITAGHKGIPWSMADSVCCLKAVIKDKIVN